MGSLALIIVFGAMLGKLLEESGAAYQITHKLINYSDWVNPDCYHDYQLFCWAAIDL